MMDVDCNVYGHLILCLHKFLESKQLFQTDEDGLSVTYLHEGTPLSNNSLF